MQYNIILLEIPLISSYHQNPSGESSFLLTDNFLFILHQVGVIVLQQAAARQHDQLQPMPVQHVSYSCSFLFLATPGNAQVHMHQLHLQLHLGA